MGKNSDTRLSGKFALVGVLFLLVIVSIIFHLIKMDRICRTWPQVTGIVTKASSRGWWDEKQQLRHYLAYAYEAGGQRYENTRFHIKQDSIQQYKRLITGLKKGDTLTVWYNPEKPEESVINVAYLRNGFVMLIVFAGFVVLSGTMIFKEYQWKKQVQHLAGVLGEDYNGKTPLPPSAVVTDQNNVVRLNTGMSVFWNFGIPFLFVSFTGIAPMLLLLDEINPDWSLSSYLKVVALCWALGAGAGVVVQKGFRDSLEIDGRLKQIRAVSLRFFRSSTRVYRFSEIVQVKMEREKWRFNNPLRNWMLYMQIQSKPTLFVCYRHRDIQPSSESYLAIVKKRLEHMIFDD